MGDGFRIHRFIDAGEEPSKLLIPIEGYEKKDLVSLKEAIEPIKNLLHNTDRMVDIALQNSNEPPDGITTDESAAIHIYTIQWPDTHDSLYKLLNRALRDERRNELKPWFSYLKLILTALYKLPPIKKTLWRAVRDPLLDFEFIPSQDLGREEEIGRGGFGVVHRARWLSHNRIVAVKTLHLTHLDKQAEKEFFKELSLVHSISYHHIVTFYGACTEIGKYALVMEYMSLGSLYKLLHKDKLVLDWSERLSIALQAANAINHLHKLQRPILHRDIKSLNFLLERSYQDYIVKVCDFGLAQTRSETTRQTKHNHMIACTLQWTAPEILRLKKYTDKSDVYSLGIVYWELAANEIPYDGYPNDIISDCVRRGERLEIPDDTPLQFSAVITKCWANDPDDRPPCSQLIVLIEECNRKQKTLGHVVDDDVLKLAENEIIQVLQLKYNDSKDEIVHDLMENGRQSLFKYEDDLLPDIYTAAINEKDSDFMKALKYYLEQQWKIRYSSNEWFVLFLKQNEDSQNYQFILNRTAEYGNKYMKNCPILSIVLQLLFKEIDDQCLTELNLFNDLWLTITNHGLKSIEKYSNYISKDLLNTIIEKKELVLFQALREYYRPQLFQLLEESNIKNTDNLYELALNNVADYGWLKGLQELQNKIIPKCFKILLTKIRGKDDSIALIDSITVSCDTFRKKDKLKERGK
ncbi:unnamed protein product [Rotaria socialis]|uniref:Protein kinase domain-containing protein n=1 Tax=Rotaria socialis TaxID=392032 RepID=A0A820M7A6_9BILA|nr:unnamed protein product [Rotaria socialis]CAF4367842.1 unnamed protein product [Rotaria socialis]